MPFKSSPSSVNVPVLSKHMIVTCPQMLTFGGEMQKIYLFLSLCMAKVIPIERQVGSAGGTVTVIKSKDFKIMSYTPK